MLAACYLLHSGVCLSAIRAVEMVNRQRCPSTMDALTYPSQIRYVYYYEALLRSEAARCSTYRVMHVRLVTVPSFSASLLDCGCTPTITFSVLARHGSSSGGDVAYYPKRIFSQQELSKDVPPVHYSAQTDTIIDIPLSSQPKDGVVAVRGDVCLSVFSEGEKMCQVYFNTGFIHDNFLAFDKARVDIAHADAFHYTYDSNFRIEITFQPLIDEPSLNLLPTQRALQQPNSTKLRSQLEHALNYGDTNIEEVETLGE
jgi:hypothetical protein